MSSKDLKKNTEHIKQKHRKQTEFFFLHFFYTN